MPGKCVFNQLRLKNKDYLWVESVPGDKHRARCKVCAKDIDIGKMGESALKSHMKAQRHLKYFDASMTTVPVKDFFGKETLKDPVVPGREKERGPIVPEQESMKTPVPGKEISITSHLTRPELLNYEIKWALKCVESHYSMNSCEGINYLFQEMFEDSDIAKQFSCGPTKCAYLISFAKGGRSEALKTYEEKTNQYKKVESQLKGIKSHIEKLGEMLKERNAKFKELSAFTRKIIQLSFASILSGNGYTGNISFNVPKELLTLEVAPKSGQSARKNHSTLSGGERSYVSLSFLLALWERTHMPFRVLDEYDVFMDSNNRQLSVDLLISKAKEMEDTQFIFLSPLDLPAMDWPKDCVKIHKMIPPKRKD